MSWTILIGAVVVLGLVSAAVFLRRVELGRMERAVRERDELLRHGAPGARLQHPVVDLARCMGCATCVAVCPEEGVLAIVHGQASVVNGAGCMGISACARECPVGAIAVTLADAESRRDIPAIDGGLEAIGSEGLFLAGEVTAQALIKTAIEHGVQVAREVSRRRTPEAGKALDLLIVGAGPAGLACALEAKRLGLRILVLDQERTWGGTVAKYPRRKLVLTQPVDLPLHGRLRKSSYTKEELMALWHEVATRAELPLAEGRRVERVGRDEAGHFTVDCGPERFVARHLCMAVGRRGSPRRLGVPGEELTKVAHSLFDATAYRGRKLLVVGGGDSAVETALALATQPGNEVTLSYRRRVFTRLRARNRTLLEERVAAGRLRVLFESELTAIHAEHVELVVAGDPALLANDEVFVMVGGLPPFPLLEEAGVSFDPALRPAPETPPAERSELRRAVFATAALALVALVFVLWHGDYYFLPRDERPAHAKHELLRPGQGLGLAFGLAALSAVGVNLAYLLRRARRWGVRFGSLRSWMTVHVATGVAAVLAACLHAALEPRSTVGGHSLWVLAALLVTGAIGRYLYAFVPRAANGRELEVDEIRDQAHALPGGWQGTHEAFGRAAREEVLELLRARQWGSGCFSRLLALLGDRRHLRRALGVLEREGLRAQVPAQHVERTLELVRRAHRRALVAAHYEDLRALASTWRYLHRWGAVLMVVLVALHVAHALIYGEYFGGGA